MNWPSFRGERARGVADGFATATTWGGETSENILWKTAIPGLGHSSPAIWGERLYVTTAVGDDKDDVLRVGLYGDIDPVVDESAYRLKVYCLDKNTGEVLWSRTAHEGVPKIKRHTKSTHANPTPATDGKHVVVLFGSEGLYGYDTNGELLWKKDLGTLDSGYFEVPEAQWGFGSSPVIHVGRVIVQADVQDGSFLAAFDVRTGREIWRTARNDVPTWSTPTIDTRGGKTRILVNGYRQIGGYDFESGKEIWTMTGGGDIPVPTPYVSGDLVYITNAHGGGSPIYAIRADATGDTSLEDGERSSDDIAWSRRGGGSYLPTTVVYRGVLYVCRDNGTLSAYDAASGERLYQKRLGTGGSGFTASAVAGDGKVFFTSEEGETHVVRAGREFELVAVNDLGEVVLATPAISEGTIFFRSRHHIIAVGRTGDEKSE